MRSREILLLAVVASCRWEGIDFDGTEFRCVENPDVCPPGYECEEGTCVPSPGAGPGDPSGDYPERVLASAPVAYYRLGEPPGAEVAVDATGRGNDGTYDVGIALGQPGALTSDPDTSVLIEGEEGPRARVTLPPALDAPEAWTYELWAYVPNRTGGDLFEGLVGAGNNPRVTWDNTEKRIIVGTSHAERWAGGPMHPVALRDRWVHVVAVWLDAASAAPTAELYVDGELVGATVFDEPIRAAAGTHYIGARDGHVQFVGRIDEVALYDRALTSSEIAGHYDAGME